MYVCPHTGHRPGARLQRGDQGLVRRRVRRRRPRRRLRRGRRSAGARTRWSSRRPGRARRWPRSCGALDRLAAEPVPADPRQRCRVLYISPLKALAVDVERNLRAPLAGMRQAGGASGCPSPTSGSRAHRRHPRRRAPRLGRQPPDILITTPESLFLMLTSQARETLRGVETVIVDEVHAVPGTKRGAHLALVAGAPRRLLRAQPGARIGLSATVRPLERDRPVPRRAARRRSRSTRRRAKGFDLQSSSRSRTWATSATPPRRPDGGTPDDRGDALDLAARRGARRST